MKIEKFFNIVCIYLLYCPDESFSTMVVPAYGAPTTLRGGSVDPTNNLVRYGPPRRVRTADIVTDDDPPDDPDSEPELQPRSSRKRKLGAVAGAAAGGTLGFIGGNLPGAIAGANLGGMAAHNNLGPPETGGYYEPPRKKTAKDYAKQYAPWVAGAVGGALLSGLAGKAVGDFRQQRRADRSMANRLFGDTIEREMRLFAPRQSVGSRLTSAAIGSVMRMGLRERGPSQVMWQAPEL